MFRAGMSNLTGMGVLLALWMVAGFSPRDRDQPRGKDKPKEKASKDKAAKAAKEKAKVKPRIIEEIKGADKEKVRESDAPKRHKWEYCSLSMKSDSPAKTKKFTYTRGNVIFETSSLKDMGEKLKMKVTPNTKTAILNFLGEKGWELVNYGGAFSKPDVSYDMYYLKRRK